MNTFALIDNTGLVVNVIVWDGNTATYTPSTDIYVDVTNFNPRPGPGWTYVSGSFVAPPSQDLTSGSVSGS